MKVWNWIRFILAILVIASFPPALLLWVAIHPFASFWRRLGPVWTYVLLGLPVLVYMAGVWLLRDTLLGWDLGANVITVVLAGFAFVAAFQLKRSVTAQLKFASLSGIPELSKDQYPGKLLTEGVYNRVRNPRYIEAFLWTLAYALFANYLGSYIVLVLSLPLIYAVVKLEERELRGRFGKAYEDYCRRVPRFVPHRGRPLR
jgi:protein-S-isoprenylcysteine O-methyltransferase Ste14